MRKADTKALGWSEKPKADWAIPTENPDEEAMKKATSVKVSSDGVKIDKEKWTDDLIKESFSEFGEIEKIARGARNVHVHYKDHESAMKAVAAKNGKTLADLKITVLVSISKILMQNEVKFWFDKFTSRVSNLLEFFHFCLVDFVLMILLFHSLMFLYLHMLRRRKRRSSTKENFPEVVAVEEEASLEIRCGARE